MNNVLGESSPKDQRPLPEQARDWIFQRIASGEFPPGHILGVATLAREMGMSRTPITDAINALIDEEVVTQEAEHRAIVRRYSTGDVAELFDMWLLYGEEAAKLCAARMSKIEREELQVRIAEGTQGLLRGTPEWRKALINTETQVGDALDERTQNRFLRQEIARIRVIYCAFFARLPFPDSEIEKAAQERADIVALLQNDKAAQAGTAMKDHLQKQGNAVCLLVK